MKISAIFGSVFFFFILYSSPDDGATLAYAEDPVSSLQDDAEDNHTAFLQDAQSSERITITKEVDTVTNSAVITASIKDVLSEEKENVRQDDVFLQTVSQNSGISHELLGLDIDIQTIVDSATLELKEKAEFSNNSPISSITNNSTLDSSIEDSSKPLTLEPGIKTTNDEDISFKIKLDTNSNELVADKVSNRSEETENLKLEVPTTEPKTNTNKSDDEAHEDIPSFSEWTQKQLEEAEKKKEQVNSSTNVSQSNGKPVSNVKKRWKNYASPDCGAKIIAANPEAISAGSVLSSSRDEYKLNACKNRIWFIVELCEAIQAKKIDLANFELFSSSPREFSIFIGDRFPTRDWQSVGQFHAKDERDIQSFDLSPQLFGKYIKFEMHSHHGSEHYCPISLFRVYGTSEFEVLETENQEPSIAEDDDDDDDEALDFESGASPKNLFSSATDAVISIVKKAAEVLGNKGNTSAPVQEETNFTVTTYTPLVNSCTTPSHFVVCDNCSDILYGNVFELMSCNSKQLSDLIIIPIIRNSLCNSNICTKYGFYFQGESATKSDSSSSYIISFFSQKVLAALCNILAIEESKVLLNISHSNSNVPISSPVTNEKFVASKNDKTSSTIHVDMTSLLDEKLLEDSSTVNSEINTTDVSQIKPTKTLPNEELNFTEVPIVEDTVACKQTVSPTSSLVEEVQNENQTKVETEINQGFDTLDVDVTTESSESLDDHLDALVSEINGDTGASNIAAQTTTPPSVPQGQKESVFLRLSNRIKALERNTSLSSQYLEELSRRYKKQVEEMQRLLDKTINAFNDENKKKEERIRLLEDHVIVLSESLQYLKEERSSWLTTTYWFLLGGALFVGILLFCHRNTDFKQSRSENKTEGTEIQRRNSVDVVSHNEKNKKKRRPSEEAMKSSGVTCSDLMINEADVIQKSKDKKRKRKKNTHVLECSKSLNEENYTLNDTSYKTVSESGLSFTPSIMSSQMLRSLDNGPIRIEGDWVGEMVKHNNILDIPFVLEESEHSSLEPLPILRPTNEDGSVKSNGTATHLSTVSSTDNESGKSRKLFQKSKGGSGKTKLAHKKSASLDYGKKFTTEDESQNLNSSYSNAPTKKEKKNTFRKIFRTFTFK